MKKNSKQQTKQQQTKSQQTKQQPAKRLAAGKLRTPFEQQLETERKQMQESGEISGVAGVDIGDKRSYVRLVGLDGELLEEVKVATNPAAIEKYFRSWPRLRVVLESGGQANWIRRLIAGLGHEVLIIFLTGLGDVSNPPPTGATALGSSAMRSATTAMSLA